MTRRAFEVLLWGLALVQFLTVQRAQRFTFPEPSSWEQWTMAAAFVVTSLGFVVRSRRTALQAGHIAVVATLLAAHPLTAFGRDGSTVILMLWLGLVLARTSIRREWLLVYASTAVGVLAVETALAAGARPEGRAYESRAGAGPEGRAYESRAGAGPEGRAYESQRPLDYGDVMGEYGVCGFLRPNLRLDVVADEGLVPFHTNSLGLRRDGELSDARADSVFRILLVGDSFVAGYRTGQADTLGAQLERILSERIGRDVEVLIAGAGHPGMSARVVSTCAPIVTPDLIVAGVTFGNDLAQSWLGSRGLPPTALDNVWMPQEATAGWPSLMTIKFIRSLRAWRLVRLVEPMVATDVISSWYYDAPTTVHLFDPGHSLGLFYVGSAVDPIRESFDATRTDLEAIAREATQLGVPTVVALFPQRFQMTDREWARTMFEYGLNVKVFDREAPNRELLARCHDAKLTCVDLLPAFREEAVSSRLYQLRGDMHWNARGHAVAARTVADALSNFNFPISRFPNFPIQ